MLIFGGLRYVVSGGNSAAVTTAKNTILYAVVGLVISFIAYAAINFVINSLAPGTSGGTNV
jgi:NADH:ubiquinone oxidoreductase subunit 6 (subunit J)